MIKVAIYARVSTNDKEQDPETQLNMSKVGSTNTKHNQASLIIRFGSLDTFL